MLRTGRAISCSTVQRFNGSTVQRFNGSTVQGFNGSTVQGFNGSTGSRGSTGSNVADALDRILLASDSWALDALKISLPGSLRSNCSGKSLRLLQPISSGR